MSGWSAPTNILALSRSRQAAAFLLNLPCSPALTAACSLFVRFLHMASPYVAGHRGRTFVVVIPGEVGAGTRMAEVQLGLLDCHSMVHTCLSCWFVANTREPVARGLSLGCTVMPLNLCWLRR